MGRGVLVVTGGSRGIGAAVSRAAAAAGWWVCLTYRRDESAALALRDELRASGAAAVAVRADVAVDADVRAAFAAADELGPVAGLVANAGIVAPKARVDEMDAGRVERMLAVNVLGPILCCREAVRRLSTRHGGPGGSIVLVSSAASRLGSPHEYVDYAASKAAVDTLGIGLAKEVAAEGVRVNVVRPGVVDTDIHASGGQPGRVAALAPSLPMGRAGRADEGGRRGALAAGRRVRLLHGQHPRRGRRAVGARPRRPRHTPEWNGTRRAPVVLRRQQVQEVARWHSAPGTGPGCGRSRAGWPTPTRSWPRRSGSGGRPAVASRRHGDGRRCPLGCWWSSSSGP